MQEEDMEEAIRLSDLLLKAVLDPRLDVIFLSLSQEEEIKLSSSKDSWWN